MPITSYETMGWLRAIGRRDSWSAAGLALIFAGGDLRARRSCRLEAECHPAR